MSGIRFSVMCNISSPSLVKLALRVFILSLAIPSCDVLIFPFGFVMRRRMISRSVFSHQSITIFASADGHRRRFVVHLIVTFPRVFKLFRKWLLSSIMIFFSLFRLSVIGLPFAYILVNVIFLPL